MGGRDLNVHRLWLHQLMVFWILHNTHKEMVKNCKITFLRLCVVCIHVHVCIHVKVHKCYEHIYTSGRECMARHTPVEDAWLNMATQTNLNDQQNNILK